MTNEKIAIKDIFRKYARLVEHNRTTKLMIGENQWENAATDILNVFSNDLKETLNAHEEEFINRNSHLDMANSVLASFNPERRA